MKKLQHITFVLLLISNQLVGINQLNDSIAHSKDNSGKTKKSALTTYSSHTLGSEELERSSALSLDDALFGKLLGLSVLQTGGFESGSNSLYFIRGLKTLANNGILILVDGFERPVSDLVPEEIESVTVLKDAAAVAVYGFKGINGVLLVTTKRGLKQKLEVRVGYEQGISQAFRLPQMLNSATYAEAYNEARANDGLRPGYNNYEMEVIRNGSMPYLYPDVNWMGKISESMVIPIK